MMPVLEIRIPECVLLEVKNINYWIVMRPLGL